MSFNIQEFDHHHHLQNRMVDDHHDMIGENQGIIRSYDCVFCQRGFTTAQALGGHMNIHRKDRATPTTVHKPSNSNTTVDKPNKEMLLEDDSNDQANATTRLFFSSNNNKSSYYSSDQYLSNGATSSFEGRFSHFLNPDNHSSKWGGYSSLLPGSHVHGRRVQDHDDYHSSPDEEEVDLELRLGHYPW